MGQKKNPIGMRLGIVESHKSRWFATKKHYADWVYADYMVRLFLESQLKPAGVSRIVIERLSKYAKLTIYAAKPGVVIGKKGEDVEKLRRESARIMGVPVQIAIEEVRKPELDAKLVSETIAQQLEKRVLFRRAMKRAVSTTMKLGAKGIKVCLSGRLGGAEIARTEWYREGRIPLHTFRACIDYGFSEASTTYGIIGVKVWIFKGEKLQATSQPSKDSAVSY